MLETYVISTAQYERQPWKNGRGETEQIAVDKSSPYLWRVSRASLRESGPFSLFPGYDRTLVLLNGGPVLLQFGEGNTRRLVPFQVCKFSGELATEAQVQAPAQDFNIFSLRGSARAGCYPVFFQLGEQMQLPIAGQEHLVHCVSGEIEIGEPSTSTQSRLHAGDTYRLRRSTDKEYLNLRARALAAGTAALWIVIHELGGS